MKTIYLCGPIADRTDAQCVVWRDGVTAAWPGKTLNPLRRDYRGRELENPAQLVADDLDDIDNSDGLLVWFDAPSVGTSMEIFYAKGEGKPIVVVDARPDRSRPLSPWLVHHVDRVVQDVGVALLLLAELCGKTR